MSQIRKRSLKATSWIYLGFFIGAINTYFFTHKDWFSPEEYGLTRALLDIGLLICAFSTFGVTSYIIKFFPYYKDNSDNRKNDLLGVATVVAFLGFLITSISLFLLEPLIIQKFSTNSILLVEYFYFVLPLAFFFLLYNILEAYAYGFDKGVFTSFLKELLVRLFTLVIIVLKIFDLINFKVFILLFSLQYASIVLILIFHLKSEKKLWLTFNISKVTRKYRKKIFAILSLTFLVIIVTVLRQVIDALVLASKQDLSKVGIFGFSAYLVSVLQAPFRSIVAITIPILSRSWKMKDYVEIQRIYNRSSINLLCFSIMVFFCIWLNFEPAINFLDINASYLEGKWVFFLLAMVAIIEMGTGVNAQIIATSTHWRFELWTSLLLTAMILPLSYFLTIRYGIMGPAFANFISFSIYNLVRIIFLYRKFNMQPFSYKTVEVIIISLIAYLVSYYSFLQIEGLFGIIVRTSCFLLIFVFAVYYRKITPDLSPILDAVNNKLKRFIK